MATLCNCHGVLFMDCPNVQKSKATPSREGTSACECGDPSKFADPADSFNPNCPVHGTSSSEPARTHEGIQPTLNQPLAKPEVWDARGFEQWWDAEGDKIAQNTGTTRVGKCFLARSAWKAAAGLAASGAQYVDGEQLKTIAFRHRTILAGCEFADEFDFDAIAAELAAPAPATLSKEQVNEAAEKLDRVLRDTRMREWPGLIERHLHALLRQPAGTKEGK